MFAGLQMPVTAEDMAREYALNQQEQASRIALNNAQATNLARNPLLAAGANAMMGGMDPGKAGEFISGLQALEKQLAGQNAQPAPAAPGATPTASATPAPVVPSAPGAAKFKLAMSGLGHVLDPIGDKPADLATALQRLGATRPGLDPAAFAGSQEGQDFAALIRERPDLMQEVSGLHSDVNPANPGTLASRVRYRNDFGDMAPPPEWLHRLVKGFDSAMGGYFTESPEQVLERKRKQSDLLKALMLGVSG